MASIINCTYFLYALLGSELGTKGCLSEGCEGMCAMAVSALESIVKQILDGTMTIDTVMTIKKSNQQFLKLCEVVDLKHLFSAIELFKGIEAPIDIVGVINQRIREADEFKLFQRKLNTLCSELEKSHVNIEGNNMHECIYCVKLLT